MIKSSFITLIITTTTLSIPTEERSIDENSSLLVNNSTNESPGRLIIVTRPNLNELCVMLNVTLDACSCNRTPDLCGFEMFLNELKNETNAYPTYRRYSVYTLTYVAVTIIASIFGLVGNALVLLVALTRRRNLSSCKLHIARLAFVSFIVSIVQIINVMPLLSTNTWVHSVTSCKTIRTVLETGSLLIIGIIVIIAIERFLLVNRGIDTGFKNNIYKHILFIGYVIFVAITVLPYTLGLNIETDTGRCIQFEGDRRNLSLPYNWFVLLIHSVIPFCIISVLYTKIIKYISKHTSCIDTSNNYLLHANKVRTNKRCENVLMTILFFFLISTLPMRIINIYMDMEYLEVRHFGERHFDGYWNMDMNAYMVLVFISYVTYPFQSTINPILYSMIDTEWRKDVMDIVRKLSHSI